MTYIVMVYVVIAYNSYDAAVTTPAKHHSCIAMTYIDMPNIAMGSVP